MVTKGRIRGNGRQLADYLLRQGENDAVRVLDIQGTAYRGDLKKSLIQMSLTTELSGRTKKGLYHVVINPAPAESHRMTDADWIKASEILEKHTGFTGQPRAMVLHEKDGRLHCHCVYQRWDFEHGKMRTNKFSRYKQNDARQEMEKAFEHLRTPEINLERPELRKLLSELWQQHTTGRGFVSTLAQKGYTVAKSDDRRPFALVNRAGRSFDLDREMKGVRIKQIKERLKDLALPDKKKVIKAIGKERADRQPETSRDKKLKELQEKLKRDRTKDRDRGR